MASKEFSVYVSIGGKIASSLGSAISQTESKLSGLTRHFKAQAAAQKAAISGIKDAFQGVMSLAAAGGIATSMKKMLGDGEDFAHEVEKLRAAGRSTQEVAEGIAAANDAIRKMPTASLTGGIKLLNETTGAFGDYKHAVENLDFNTKLASVLKNTSGSHDPEHDIGSLIKALEIRGSASNPERYRHEAGELQRALTFYGGRLKADDIYTFASNAPSAIKRLNERFLTKIAPSLIQEMGGDKAGTGLTAFQKVIQGGITDQEQAKAWVGLKMISGTNVKRDKKTHQIIGWQPGAMKDSRLAMEDPLAFMEKDVLPSLEKYGIGGKKVDIKDPIALGNALKLLFKKEKSNAFAQAIGTLIDRTRLKKDEGLINQVLTLDKTYNSAILNDPKMARFAIIQAMHNLGTAISLPVMKPLAENLIWIAQGVNHLSASLMQHPEAARALSLLVFGIGALAALRLANAATGIGALAVALGNLSIAATLGLATRLIGVARGIAALSIAATVGLAGRLRTVGTALALLAVPGGGRIVLGAIGASLLRFGKVALLFPVMALRGIGLALWGLVANPVGLAITAVVVALTALGVWVANNWSGLKTFFSSFADSFMKGLGPDASQGVTKIADALKSAYDWVSKLLGPIDETGVKWKSWGESAGAGAAAVVNSMMRLPSEIAKIAQDAWNALVNFDWKAAGQAIVNKIVEGIKSMPGAIAGAIKGGIGNLFGGPPAPTGPAANQHRAMGGPVRAGGTYLVGERGPELFTPRQDGRILTAGATAALAGAGPSVDVSAISRAGSLAESTGRVIHASLDTVAKPQVDTTGLDQAIVKASKLSSIIGAINGGDIDLGSGIGAGGRGKGGGGGGSWNGKALGIPAGAGIGHAASSAERAAFTKAYAKSIGVDPTTALRVSQSEGFYKYLGDHGRSFGEWQLFTGGGLGNIAMRRGINIRDPKTWKEQTKFALNWAKTHGWGDWHGAARVGISRWHGIRGARAPGGAVDGGSTYLVGERGPELYTPGNSGRITSNERLRGLLSRAEKTAKATKRGQSINHVRGDTHYSPIFNIHGGQDLNRVKQTVEAHFWDLVRQAEADQRGLLSD